MLRLFKKSTHLSNTISINPMDHWVSLMLRHSYAEQVTAIVFGLPRALRESVPEERLSASLEALGVDPFENLPTEFVQEHSATRRAFEQSSFLKSAAGWQTVPTWLRIDGTLHPWTGTRVSSFIGLMLAFEDRLLSLDGSKENPKPMRFIEYESATDASERCFAEVELWLEEDNTFRIEILGHRREPAAVRAMRGYR